MIISFIQRPDAMKVMNEELETCAPEVNIVSTTCSIAYYNGSCL